MDYFDYSEGDWENWETKQLANLGIKDSTNSTNIKQNWTNTQVIKKQNYKKSNLFVEFSGLAWLKLKWFRDKGHSEVSAWAITKKENPLYVTDLKFIKQKNTVAFTKFDDDAIALMCYQLGEEGIEPNNCMRIWVHTHPGNSASPSGHDETQFNDCIGVNDWFVMLILAKDDSTTCRIGMNTSFGKTSQEINVKHSFSIEDLKDKNIPEIIKSWEEEYNTNVSIETYQNTTRNQVTHIPGYDFTKQSKISKQITDKYFNSKLVKMPYQNIRAKNKEGVLHTCSKKNEFNILVEFDSYVKDNFSRLTTRVDKGGVWEDDEFNLNIELVASVIDSFSEEDIAKADYMLIDVYNRYYLGTLLENIFDIKWTEYSTDEKYVVEKDKHIEFILSNKEIKNGKIIVNDTLAGAV